MRFELDRHPFFWLTQVIGLRDRELAQGLRGYGIRVPEWRALAALYSQHLCTMSQLSDYTTIDRTTLTRTVDRMEEAGWLERRADEADMRVTRLVLKPAGRRMFERIWPTVEQFNLLALEGLSRNDIASLYRILARMRANLEEYVAEGETHAS